MTTLFTAVRIPQNQATALLNLRPYSLIFNDPGVLHLPLHFIGEKDDVQIETIMQNLSEIKFDSYIQKIIGVGAVNNKTAPYFLWAGIDYCAELINLHKSIGDLLLKAGTTLEEREYKPHITIATLDESQKDLIEPFVNDHKDFKSHFNITGFSLFSSEPGKSGPIDKELKKFNFQ